MNTAQRLYKSYENLLDNLGEHLDYQIKEFLWSVAEEIDSYSEDNCSNDNGEEKIRYIYEDNSVVEAKLYCCGSINFLNFYNNEDDDEPFASTED